MYKNSNFRLNRKKIETVCKNSEIDFKEHH